VQARRGTVWTIYESGPLIIFGEKCRTPRAARQARFFPILSGCLILVTTRHRQRLGDWICIGLTSAGYSVSSPYLSSPSHRSMEMPLDPGRAGLDRARFCAPTTSLDAAPGHCVSARVSQLAGAKAGRTLGVPAVERRLRWGHQRSVTHDYVCPLRGCGPRGCLSGFEARTLPM